MRIYNPQNQFGQPLATELKVENLQSLVLKGMGIDETYINNIKDGGNKDLVTRISGNEAAIAKLTAGTLEYQKVAYVDPKDVEKEYAKEEYHNKILLVPSQPETTEGVNKYTEYLIVKTIVNPGTEEEKIEYHAERLGEIGIDTKKITDEIDAINTKIGEGFDETNTVAKAISDEASCRFGADNEILKKIGDGFSADSTVASQLAAVKTTAEDALQGVNATAVTGDATHGVSFSLTENDCHNLEGSVSIDPASFSDNTWTDNDTKLPTAGDVKKAIAKAIETEDAAVDAKTLSATGTSTEGGNDQTAPVKVVLGGTIETPTITVTTKDIAKASELSALDTYIKGEVGQDEKGGIEVRLAAVEESIGGGTEGIGARVTALETSVGSKDDAASATGSVYARIAATKAVADAALQGVGTVTEGSNGIKLSASEDGNHNLTVGLEVTPAVADTTEGDTKGHLSGDAVTTAAVVEARAELAKTDAVSYTDTLVGTVPAKVGDVDTKTVVAYVDAKVAAESSDLTTEIANRKKADAALVTAVTGDTDTGTASTIVTIKAVTTPGDEAAGTGKSVTLGAIVAEASIDNSGTKIVIKTGSGEDKKLVTAKVAQDAIDAAEARAKALSDAAQAEAEKAHADAQGIIAQTIISKGTVIECGVTAGSEEGTFNVTMPDGIAGHVMRVCWKNEDFVCMHGGGATAPTVTLYDLTSATAPTGWTKPEAGDIKVFVMVTVGTPHAHA